MIVPFVIGTYGTSNVPSKYYVKEQHNSKNLTWKMILNNHLIYFEHWSKVFTCLKGFS